MLTACNGGHEEPVLRTGNGFEPVHDQHNLVLGGIQRAEYAEYEIRMQPGDMLFVYTDGVPDAKGSGERYGASRLLEALNASAPEEPEKVLAAVTESIDAFTGGTEQFDDLTMLFVRWKGKQPG